ncbi:unnamed protein product [Brachionus calyciflorus]|uniref:PIN domain-containing protein n=1 Tax=Brachionus calyciflorus TaxID=104777 RepID=A0A813QKT9_9BILA|nr:unnamed protein product [Brachionus calyciflorus]
MNEDVKKFSHKQSESKMTANSSGRKNRRPEMARYQPPSSRVSTSQNTSDNPKKIEKEINNKTDSSETKLTTPHKTNSFSKEEQNIKTSSAGIIKLDQNSINEILNKNEKLSCNEKNEEKDKHLIVRSSHSERLQSNESRTLFDPNNPDKPILVDLKNRNFAISKTKKPQIELKKEAESVTCVKEQEKSIDSKNDELINRVNLMAKRIQLFENNLKNLITSFEFNQYFDQFLKNVNSLRENLDKLCIDALFTHLETSTNLNIDLNHWRSCYHLLIEILRKEYNSNKNLKQAQREQLAKCLNAYIDEGVTFYKNLVNSLEKKFLKFNSDLYIDLNYYDKTLKIIDTSKSFNTQIRTKDAKYCLLAINRILIYVGDLERYREMIFPSQPNQRDYSQARFYYLKSICFAPKISRAYHQLAILAIYTKRRLDSCYYYFRCLEVSPPLTSVRQSLNQIFEEVRQKSDLIQKNIKQAILNKEKYKTNTIRNKNRVEIWYKPTQLNKSLDQSDTSDSDLSNTESSSDEKDEIESKNLSLNEINKRFMLNYLNLIGKLFTKVGMETYDDIYTNMLKQLSELLKRSPESLGKNRLLQITVINISLIDLISKSMPSDNLHNRSQLLECSLQLGLDVFCLILNRFNIIFKKNLSKNLDSWNQLFPSIKIFIDWLLCNIKIWYPFPEQVSYDTIDPNFNKWEILIEFFNLMNTNYKLFENQEINSHFYKIKLEEDLELAGFVPLLSLPREDYDFQNSLNINKDYVKNYLNEELVEKEKVRKRMQKCLIFADYLCGLEQPLFKFDVVNNCYSLIEVKLPSKKMEAKRTISTCSSSSLKSSLEEVEKFDLGASYDGMSGDELNDLKEKHRILKTKLQEQQKQEEQMQSLVQANLQRQIELEIRPKFIVADTNCFIDHLNLIDRILNSNHFVLIVPLLVLSELEKLAKSISNLYDDSQEHAEYLQKNARKAIEFLNLKFEKRERNIKAMTSQGSILETIQFRTEEVVKPGTNDELILGCCLYYCRDNARDFMPNNKTDAIHLFRDVVLLTEDRHLRMKAHTRNVPVKDIKQFCKWSGLLISSNMTNNKK